MFYIPVHYISIVGTQMSANMYYQRGEKRDPVSFFFFFFFFFLCLFLNIVHISGGDCNVNDGAHCSAPYSSCSKSSPSLI